MLAQGTTTTTLTFPWYTAPTGEMDVSPYPGAMGIPTLVAPGRVVYQPWMQALTPAEASLRLIPPTMPRRKDGGVMDFLTANKTAVLIVSGGLFLLAMMRGGRR